MKSYPMVLLLVCSLIIQTSLHAEVLKKTEIIEIQNSGKLFADSLQSNQSILKNFSKENVIKSVELQIKNAQSSEDKELFESIKLAFQKSDEFSADFIGAFDAVLYMLLKFSEKDFKQHPHVFALFEMSKNFSRGLQAHDFRKRCVYSDKSMKKEFTSIEYLSGKDYGCKRPDFYQDLVSKHGKPDKVFKFLEETFEKYLKQSIDLFIDVKSTAFTSPIEFFIPSANATNLTKKMEKHLMGELVKKCEKFEKKGPKRKGRIFGGVTGFLGAMTGATAAVVANTYLSPLAIAALSAPIATIAAGGAAIFIPLAAIGAIAVGIIGGAALIGAVGGTVIGGGVGAVLAKNSCKVKLKVAYQKR